MLTITKDMGEFAAAHTLTYHDGGCANLHGHNYRVEVTLIGNAQVPHVLNPESGMIIDFSRLKDLYKEHVHAKLDHAMIFGINKPHWYTAFVNFTALNQTDGNSDLASAKDIQENSQVVVDKLLGKVAHLDIPETTAECLAGWILDTLEDVLVEKIAQQRAIHRLKRVLPIGEVRVYSVSVWETSSSYATYVNPELSPGLTARFHNG